MDSLNIEKINSKYTSGLYLISTPIGNLGDITIRSLDLIKNSDIIYCENPAISIKLLHHYEIKKKLYKYFDYSSADLRSKICDFIKQGLVVSYLSDCGTPTISDPGYKLVRHIRDNNLDVFAVPGACSAIAALSISALPTDKFYFFGFAARTSSKRQTEFKTLRNIPGSIVFFESANRLLRFLEDARQVFTTNNFVVIKEITKKFETVRRYNFETFAEEQIDFPLKGEFIVIIENNTKIVADESKVREFLEIAKTEVSDKDAINLAKKLFNLPKKDLYNMVLEIK
ncbi:MAG: 16S rRNA (cytidine(1402)-2'-O)-methyltransferase [Rickettsiales bacterium]|jgi:16S rRNA (cytidine1402-2'-O)-methyltransferase|nr:16S rRNA (cytidine(1402)-2'-O)-methyltransferase [Rickettsiales bacterium]